MKILGKTEERAIDSLLRAQRSNFTGTTCEGFDADRANAYIERMLNQNEQQRYESHIAACGNCRRLTVALMRAAQADPASSAATITPVEKSSRGWITALRGFIPALATPRFALVATAVVALAISVPLILSNRNQQSDIAVKSSAEAASGDKAAPNLVAKQNEAPPATQQAGQSAMADHRRDEATGNGAGVGAATESKDSEESGVATGMLAQTIDATKTTAAEQSAPAPPPAASDNFTRKESEPDRQAKTDDTARPTERARSQPSETATAESEKPLPMIDRNEARTLPEADRNSQPRVTELSRGRAGVEVARDKDKPVIRPEDDSRPKSESVSENRRGGRIADGPASRLRDTNDGVKPPARSTREMKVQGKKFFLLDGIWTDKDYRKDKEMPIVPVEQGSELYNQLMTKHSKLKLYFASFADQSAIIVYKGTVYKLTPKK